MKEIFGLAVCHGDSCSPAYSEHETLEQARECIKNRFTQRLLGSGVTIAVLKGNKIMEKYNAEGKIEEPKPEIEKKVEKKQSEKS